jgi:hypothetical protein
MRRSRDRSRRQPMATSWPFLICVAFIPLRTPRRIARLLADYLGLESHQRRPVWRVSSRLRFLLVDGLDVTRSERATRQRLAFWLASHHAAVRNDANDVFSRDTRISARTSAGTRGRPVRARLFHLQNQRKPWRCEAMTVAGRTMIRGRCHPVHTRDSQTQKTRSAGASRSRARRDRSRTWICSTRDFTQARSAERRTSRTTSFTHSVRAADANSHRTNRFGLFSRHT